MKENLKKNIKIGIDALGINDEGGGRTSILHYLNMLTSQSYDWEFIIYLSEHESSLNKPNIKQVILPFKRGIIARLFMQLFLPFEIIIKGIDLIHFTKGQASLVPKAKTVLTIHDLTIVFHPDIHSKLSAFYWKVIQPWITRKMDAVFAVSINTAKDIIEQYKVNPEKITVIYNASQFYDLVNNNKLLPVPQEIQDEKPESYILYVGVLALKKNLETLVRAIDLLVKRHADFPPLVLVGPRYSESDAGYIIDLVDALNLSEYIIYKGKVKKEELLRIYKNALIFVFPSIHEGFGIPCLEAMQLGVPLIASKTSGIIEVVGDAGILIDEYQSPEVWADAIESLFNDRFLRSQLIQKGLLRSEDIHSRHSPVEAINIYKTLLSIQ